MIRSYFLLPWIVLTGLSCQTTKSVEVTLPAAMEGAFDTCGKSDGEFSFVVEQKNVPAFNGTAEWAGESPHKWEIIVYHVMGQNLLRTKYDKAADGMIISGPLATKVPKIATNRDGFITVDGHFVALKASEIPCLLKWKFPRTWRTQVYQVENKDSMIRLYGGDDERDWEISAPKLANLRNRDICTTVRWSRFLGMFKSHVSFCMRILSPQRGVVSGIDNYRVEWKNAEDS